MHLSADGSVLACGGLLSLLNGEDGIFFFDVTDARNPKFIKATSAAHSAITDDFLPLASGGFLVTQMGSNTGGAPGRIAEFDKDLNLVHEWPDSPPADGLNPHGISVLRKSISWFPAISSIRSARSMYSPAPRSFAVR